MQNEGLTGIWGKVWLNGSLVDAGDAAVSPFDRGMLYGDGVYETLRVYAGVPFMLDAHLNRMARGCATIRLEPPDRNRIKAAVGTLLEVNGLGDAYLRITVTRGATGELWHSLTCSEPTILIITKPMVPRDPGAGIKLVVSRCRTDERSPLSGIKHTGILAKIVAREEAVACGADDALLLDTRGFVSEATSSNIFWTDGETVYTPSLGCGILEGITRGIVIENARRDGMNLVEGEFTLDSLCSAKEAFLTSSTWEVAPVLSCGDTVFPVAASGPVTQLLGDLYRAAAPG